MVFIKHFSYAIMKKRKDSLKTKKEGIRMMYINCPHCGHKLLEIFASVVYRQIA